MSLRRATVSIGVLCGLFAKQLRSRYSQAGNFLEISGIWNIIWVDMRVASTVLLILFLSCIAGAQKMTDRDLDGLKGKVKTVEDRSQKIGPDGTPLEEPKIDWETTYNEDGDLVETMEFGVAKSRTTYFIYKGERVSKTEYIRDSPQKKTKLPANLPPVVEKKRGPYDYKLQYKYDKSGRIVQVNRNTEPAMLSSNSKYA